MCQKFLPFAAISWGDSGDWPVQGQEVKRMILVGPTPIILQF